MAARASRTMGAVAGVDRIYAEAYVTLSGVQNMSQIVLQLTCNGASTLGIAADQSVPGNSGTLYGPSDTVPLVFRTPPIVCPTGTTGVLAQLQLDHERVRCGRVCHGHD